MQRARAALGGGADRRASVEEKLRRLGMPLGDRCLQRLAWRGAMLEQQADEAGVAPARGEDQWRHTLDVGLVGIAERLEEQACDLRVACEDRAVQRCSALLISRVDFDVAQLQERCGLLCVAR